MAVDPRQVITETWSSRGLDPRHGLVIAQLESGLDPNAQNPKSSAGGLFQFIDSTANQYGLTDRRNPYQNADAGARLYADNAAAVRRALGREPTVGEMYLAHQQGAGGAARLLANPNALAVDIVGADAVRLNGGNENMTAGEFANLWISKAEQEAQRLGIAGGPERVYQAGGTEQPAPLTTDATQIANIFAAYRDGRMTPEQAAEYEAAVQSGAMPIPEGATLGQAAAPVQAPTVTPQQAQSVYDAYVSGNRMTPEIAAEYEAAVAAGTMPLPAGITALPAGGGSLLPGGDGPAPIARQEGSIAANLATPMFQGANQALEGALGRGPSVAGQMLGETDSFFGRNVTNRAVDLGLAALQGLGGLAAGAGGLVGDVGEAFGMSRNSAERLGRDMAAAPEAFAGSGSALAPRLPTGVGVARTGPLGEAATTAGLRGGPDVAQTARVAAADAAIQAGRDTGVRVMTSDALPPTTFAARWMQSMGEKIPVAGTGGPRVAQMQERTDAINNLVREYAPAGTTVDDLLPLLSDDLVRQRGANVKQYNDMKTEVIQRLSAAGEVDTTRTISAIDAEIARLRATNNATTEPIVRELETFRAAIQNQDLENIEINRSLLGSAFSNSDQANVRTLGEKSLRSIYGPLREDMRDFIVANGERRDVNKWEVANRRLAESMGELESTALRRSLRNADANPETVRALLFSQNRSDVQGFYNTLSPTGRQNARAAVLLEALGQGRSPDVEITPTRFSANVQRLARQTGVVFNGQDRQALVGLERVLRATQRSDTAALNPPTGLQNAPFLGGIALTGVAGGPINAVIGAGGLGAVARIYESPQMRNLLVGIARARAGSGRERDLIAQYEQLASAALRAGAAGSEDQPNVE